MEDDDLEIQLRADSDVAERCIVLAALVRRLWIESSADLSQSEDWKAEAFDLREWLRSEGVWSNLTEAEVVFVESPLGRATEESMAYASWQAEGLAAIGWALGLTDALDPGYQQDISALIQAVPTPWDSIASWEEAASLRSEAEIAIERERAEILEWRVATEVQLRDSIGREREEYVAAIAEVAGEARSSGLLDSDDNDFMIGERSMGSFFGQELERLTVAAEERLRALNWVCGFGDTWDDVPLEI